MKSRFGVVRFGGITLILSGILFFAVYLLVLPVPDPPLPDADLLAWLKEWKFNLSMADEVLLFAALALLPSTVALHRVLVKTDPIKTWLGCSVMAVAVPVYIVLDIVLGRLVYPVYHLELSPDIYRLVLSLYYGGMHMIAILMCIATIVLSLAIRRSGMGERFVYLGFAAGIADVLGAFPWLTGAAVELAHQVLFAAWFIAVGLKLLGHKNEAEA